MCFFGEFHKRKKRVPLNWESQKLQRTNKKHELTVHQTAVCINNQEKKKALDRVHVILNAQIIVDCRLFTCVYTSLSNDIVTQKSGEWKNGKYHGIVNTAASDNITI